MEIDVLVAGDFCPLNRLAPKMANGSINELFNDLLPIIRNAELAVVNLECPLTDNHSKIDKSGPSLKADGHAAKVLSQAGFKMVTLANNHIMDFSTEGLRSTLNHCEKEKLETLGAGFNLDEARTINYQQIGKKRVAIINFAENEFATTNGNHPGANPLDTAQNYYDIQDASRTADYVVVIVHGGHELYDLPSPRIQQTFWFFADAGADAVIGHHPHCYSGYEIYKGKPLFYSLGNFLFDDPKVTDNRWHTGFMLGLHFGSSVEFQLYPYTQCLSKVGVELMNETAKAEFNSNLSRLNMIIADEDELQKSFDEYCKRVERMYRAFLEPFSGRILRFLQRRHLLPGLLSLRKQRLYLNLMRCEAHRDVIVNLLK